MFEYKQRLLTDSNYTKDDYQLDYIRRKILKIPSKPKSPPVTQEIPPPVTQNDVRGDDGNSQCNDDDVPFDFDKDFFNSFQSNFY